LATTQVLSFGQLATCADPSEPAQVARVPESPHFSPFSAIQCNSPSPSPSQASPHILALLISYLYRAQGKYEQAELLLKHALAIHEKQLGLD